MNNFYPINIDISKLNVLIVGLGNVGYRKLQNVLNAKSVKVISKEISKDKIIFLKENKISYELRAYENKDLKYVDMVFACTDDEYVQSYISKDIANQNRFILANYCKIQDKSNFSNMSIIQKEDYAIAISTYNKNPKKTRNLRERLEKCKL